MTLTEDPQDEAVHEARDDRKASRTSRKGEPAAVEDRFARSMQRLERNIWPLVPACELGGKPLTREEEEAILGLGPDGV